MFRNMSAPLTMLIESDALITSTRRPLFDPQSILCHMYPPLNSNMAMITVVILWKHDTKFSYIKEQWGICARILMTVTCYLTNVDGMLFHGTGWHWFPSGSTYEVNGRKHIHQKVQDGFTLPLQRQLSFTGLLIRKTTAITTKASEEMDTAIVHLATEAHVHDCSRDSVTVDVQLTSMSVQHCDDCK